MFPFLDVIITQNYSMFVSPQFQVAHFSPTSFCLFQNILLEISHTVYRYKLPREYILGLSSFFRSMILS